MEKAELESTSLTIDRMKQLRQFHNRWWKSMGNKIIKKLHDEICFWLSLLPEKT